MLFKRTKKEKANGKIDVDLLFNKLENLSIEINNCSYLKESDNVFEVLLHCDKWLYVIKISEDEHALISIKDEYNFYFKNQIYGIIVVKGLNYNKELNHIKYDELITSLSFDRKNEDHQLYIEFLNDKLIGRVNELQDFYKKQYDKNSDYVLDNEERKVTFKNSKYKKDDIVDCIITMDIYFYLKEKYEKEIKKKNEDLNNMVNYLMIHDEGVSNFLEKTDNK